MTQVAKKSVERKLPQLKPATDIIDTEHGFVIYVDMPGVDKNDLVIDLNEDELKIAAKTSYVASPEEKLGHTEFGNGEYVRSFTISHIVDRDKIGATLKNGVLVITLPKSENALPRKIQITAAQ